VPQKKSQENINSRLALVMKSGKFTLGTKTSIKCMRSGKGEAACHRSSAAAALGRRMHAAGAVGCTRSNFSGTALAECSRTTKSTHCPIH
jgi:hypothetical protein